MKTQTKRRERNIFITPTSLYQQVIAVSKNRHFFLYRTLRPNNSNGHQSFSLRYTIYRLQKVRTANVPESRSSSDLKKVRIRTWKSEALPKRLSISKIVSFKDFLIQGKFCIIIQQLQVWKILSKVVRHHLLNLQTSFANI